MKKHIFLIPLIIFTLFFTACNGTGGESTATNASDNISAGSVELNMEYSDALPISTQLIIGTFELEETALAVDAQLASELLPLWKAVRSLSSSETVAQEEMDAIIKQIQDTMAPEQIEAIAAMQLTREDMTIAAEKMGLEISFGASRFSDMTPEQQATAQAARESGQPLPGGGVPGAGSGRGSGEGVVSPEARATAQAERGGTGRFTSGINSALLDAMIELLEAKN